MNKNNGEFRFAAVLMAAGNSSRLGQPKQLLKWKGMTLVRRACMSIIEAKIDHVIVVVGAYREAVSQEIEYLPVTIIDNENWEEGMGSSIRTGMEKVSALPIDAAMFMVCDQPNIDASHLQKLKDLYLTEHLSIVTSSYQGVQGVPALFDKKWFDVLAKMKGDKGAQRLFQDCPAGEFGSVPLEGGEIDIDTPDDWEKFSKR